MEFISSSPSDIDNYSVEFPLKSKLCLFCVQPITSNSSDPPVTNEQDNCDFNCEPDLISQSTFLQAIGLLCEYLNIDQKFGRVEQWALFGVHNFVNFLCCDECAVVVQKLVKLHQLILETQASLEKEIETLTNHIIQSSWKATGEYSINACVQFREEIIKVQDSNLRGKINKNVIISENQSRQETPTRKKRQTISKGTLRPMPLSKKRPSPHHQIHTPTQTIIPESFVKLERLNPSSSSIEDFNEDEDETPSSPISITNDPFTEDLHENNSDVDYQPIPRRTRRSGTKGHRKRGRPPKSSKKLSNRRPQTKSTINVKVIAESDEEGGHVHDKDSNKDTATTTNKNAAAVALTTHPKKIKRGRPGKYDPAKPLTHSCDQCPKSFKCYTELRIHKITHIPLEIRRQHQCDQCGEKFINQNTLKGHLARVHFKNLSQDLVCGYCARRFFSKERSKYEAHLRSHTGEKPYQCAECGKGFHQKWNLTLHERLHGEDTVTCEFCSISFKTQKYLRRHQRKHHKEFVQERDPKETQKYKHIEHTENFIGPKLMFPCEPCQHVYRFKSILVSHLKRMHNLSYDKSEDFPNMWTFEDEGWVVNGKDERPPPPGGWRGRVKKCKVEKEEDVAEVVNEHT